MIHCAQTQKEAIIATQVWRPLDYTLLKIKTSPVALVSQDLTGFICLAHTQQVNFAKNRVKKVRNRDHKSAESGETLKQTCKIINRILLQKGQASPA